jgi:Bacterial regulatory proteins, luxR family
VIGDRRLTVRAVRRAQEILLLLEEDAATIPPGAFASLGLTRREGEVLGWVAKGKTNPEVGSILGLSPPYGATSTRSSLQKARCRDPHRRCRARVRGVATRTPSPRISVYLTSVGPSLPTRRLISVVSVSSEMGFGRMATIRSLAAISGEMT